MDVEECFHLFSRLSSSVALETKKSWVEALMAELSLEKCRDTKIGDARVKGVSGGERFPLQTHMHPKS